MLTPIIIIAVGLTLFLSGRTCNGKGPEAAVTGLLLYALSFTCWIVAIGQIIYLLGTNAHRP